LRLSLKETAIICSRRVSVRRGRVERKPAMLNLVPLGDRAWLARFASEAEARNWASAARCESLSGVTDVVLAYRTVSIHVGPAEVDWTELEARLRSLSPSRDEVSEGRVVTLPVLYDGDDLSEVSRLTGLAVDGVISLHHATIYNVFAIGFQPGFPYAGFLLAPLDRVPRRACPRVRVPAGSVAIASGQTGIYPSELPGGWHLIGRTPLAIVDFASNHFPIQAGDRLRFLPIDAKEFEARKGEPLR